jgi:hypothetical protein
MQLRTGPSSAAATSLNLAAPAAPTLVDSPRSATSSPIYFKGSVKKDLHGQFISDDPFIDSLLKLAPEDLRNIQLQCDRADLAFHMDPRLERCYTDFEELCSVRDVEIRKNAKSQKKVRLGEEDIPILIPSLLKVILEGRDAFKSEARVGLSGRDEQHPYDYLAEMMPRVESSNTELQRVLNGVLSNRPDYRARLAASQLLKVATEKQPALAGWAASTALAALFQPPWVELVIPAAMKSLGGLSPTRTAAAIAGINMIPSTAIEMIDAAIGFAILSIFKKKEVSLREIAPKAALAGLISGVTSFPYNFLQQSGGIPEGSYPWLRNAANLLLNFAAAVTQVMGAGISVPMEAEAGKSTLTAALAQSVREPGGLLSMPPGIRDAKQAEAYIKELARLATHCNPSDGVAQASVPLMLFAAALSFALNSKGIVTHGQHSLIPEAALQIIDITTFQPIEAHTLHLVWLASKADLWPLMKSDERKHKMLLTALTQAEASGKPFTRDDLNRIDPNLLRKMGDSISDVVMSGIHLFGRGTRVSARVDFPSGPANEQNPATEEV